MHTVDTNNIEDLPVISIIEWKYSPFKKCHHHIKHCHRTKFNHRHYSHIYSPVYNSFGNCTNINNCLYKSACLAYNDHFSIFLIIFIFSLMCSFCCKLTTTKSVKKKVITVKVPDIEEPDVKELDVKVMKY